jgi:hypothetical protein
LHFHGFFLVFQVRVHLAHGEYWTSCLTQQTQVILQIPQKDAQKRQIWANNGATILGI